MTAKNTIKKLSILLGLFLTAVGTLSNDYNFLTIGIILTIIGEGIFLI